jgi:hypothetical protein
MSETQVEEQEIMRMVRERMSGSEPGIPMEDVMAEIFLGHRSSVYRDQ